MRPESRIRPGVDIDHAGRFSRESKIIRTDSARDALPGAKEVLMTAAKWVRIALAVALALPAALTQAQDFPNKSVRLIVAFPPGGPADISARLIAGGLESHIKQPVVVENRPGAGSVPAMQALRSAPADGHTLMMASNTFAISKWLYKSVTFDPLKDARAVAGVSKNTHVVVVAPSFQGKGINDLIRMAKEHPGKVNYASAGTGNSTHLAVEHFMQLTGTKMTHVPYKGSGVALPAVMGGQVDLYFDALLSAYPMIKGGKLKALGVTSLSRVEALPDVPTLDEQGVKGFELYSWFGVVARSETPNAIVARLNEAINKVLQTPSVRERIAAPGAVPIGGGPQVFQKMIESDYEMWGKVIRSVGISLD